jgi:hypothetical protein
MCTLVYGASDNLIEVEGELFSGEINYPMKSDDHVTLVFSDGTILKLSFEDVWEIQMVHRGNLFNRIDKYSEDEDYIYSDKAYFNNDLKWTYCCNTEKKIQNNSLAIF